MADDERSEEVDAQVAQWLEVEPLDEVTRRRLVANAVRESDVPVAPASAQPARAWRWVAAAAAIVVVLVVGLALLSTRGGDDSEVATRDETSRVAPKATESTTDVGDFGDLDDPANLAALRTALEQPAASAAPQAAGDSSSQLGTAERAAPGSSDARVCGLTVPEGSTTVAQGTGTIGGRRATVVLVESADGTRTVDAVLEDPCEVRHLR